MKIIKIALTPLEPYFFGNDRNLRYAGVDGNKTKAISYYAVSEKIPSQSTLFGVLRYLGLLNKNSDYSMSEEDKLRIGKSSFHLLEKNKHGFGKILSISNLFLRKIQKGTEEELFYVKMPLDHQISSELNEEPNSYYTPFSEDCYQEVYTSQGNRILPVKYKVKNGFAQGYINLKDHTYLEDGKIFKKCESIGIQVNKEADGYYKRARYLLEDNYSFAFFATVEDDFALSNQGVVYMGYGKSAFAVTTYELKGCEQLPNVSLLAEKSVLKDCTKRVALSDLYVRSSLSELYQCCAYVHTQSKEYREFYTNYEKCNQRGRFQRGEYFIHLITSGSVFYVKNTCLNEFDRMTKDENAKIAGFNYMAGI